ncbi:hypothetical protein LO762_04495 [Actinocorallia sp. API 0066]|uniref:hypothetical protein n=1 Tax=Actinocorallia sp. API 0066 TaxID=2896846 RepID=UPI001E3F0475|nr:hypothetical protein [Actinocorallia sp. API 0066]MCD0448458.1 hypothetical protein [Actinocorallia sp. API 0066]
MAKKKTVAKKRVGKAVGTGLGRSRTVARVKRAKGSLGRRGSLGRKGSRGLGCLRG